MIAKIGRGANIYGVLSYNQIKVDRANGEILFMHKMMETPDGQYTVTQLSRSFEPYLLANKKTEKPVLHISLNPDPKEKVSDEQYKLIAKQYMREMGYGKQPFVVFKHTDTSRTHIHIVSVCIDENGKKISDKFEKVRSMNVCREIERKYELIPATEQTHNRNDKIFHSVNYQAGDIKSQVASVVRHLPGYYRFQSLGTYNALLSLFNITAEEVKAEVEGTHKHGLVYFALNEHGEKVSNPFKASLFGKSAGIAELQKHFEISKEQMKASPAKAVLKHNIEAAMNTTSDEVDFKQQLQEQGINVVVRRNDTGRIYGITFIDHESRSVWNGSKLDKDLSANVFNEKWKHKEAYKEDKIDATIIDKVEAFGKEEQQTHPHSLFDFLKGGVQGAPATEYGLAEGIGGLLPGTQGEDYEELEFEKMVRKKRKGRKRR